MDNTGTAKKGQVTDRLNDTDFISLFELKGLTKNGLGGVPVYLRTRATQDAWDELRGLAASL